MKHKLKTTLSIIAIGIMSKLNAQEPADTYLETRNHCKFIKNRTHVVVNYRDTLPIYGIDTIRENDHKKIVCNMGQNKKLIFDPYYYKTTPWLPPIDAGDPNVRKMLNDDAILTVWYYYYDKHDKEQQRDSVEQELLRNRAALIEHARTHKK